ncbi:MAG: ATP synthase subunit I [Ilumatobacteraceae bacterium]
MHSPSALTTRLSGPSPEVDISRDMIRRGLIVAPVLVAICGVIWGMRGVSSSAYGIALVLFNFGMAAGLIAVTARISLGLMMAAILFGYLIRLGILFLAFFVVKDFGWVSRPALGATMIVTHLGLLVWELKFVAASLAYPGLKPNRSHSPDRKPHRART